MAERYDYSLDETLNLYLDGRLSGEKLEAFERRMQSNPKLRRAVEFHRGLTLDFREETPSLPPGYVERARARLRADAGAAREPRRPFWFSSPASLRILATAGAMLVVALIVWPVARRAISPTSDALDFPDSNDRGAGVAQEMGQPDEETLEALRSLGYISSGGGGVDEKDAKPGDAMADKVSGPAVVEGPAGAGSRGIAPSPRSASEIRKKKLKEEGIKDVRSDEGFDDRPASSRVERDRAAALPYQPVTPSVQTTPDAEKADTEPDVNADDQERQAVGSAGARDAVTEPARGFFFGRAAATKSGDPAGEGMVFQILSVGRSPEVGSDHEVIAAAGAWSTLFEGSGDDPPALDFTKQRAVLLREALGGDPPARLNVETVAVQAGVLVITCRVERPEDAADATFGPGQVVLIPAGDLPIRVVILP